MGTVKDAYILDCETYNDYLNTFITPADLKYLQSVHYSRMLVELGYSTQADLLQKDQFELKKLAIKEFLHTTKQSWILFSEGIKITDPFLIELAAREEANHQKNILTIIFVRYMTKAGFEVSGYIDFEQSLRKSNTKAEDAVDWRAVFAGKRRLRPQPTDLSYHDWRSNVTAYNDSDNFRIIDYPKGCLSFMHRGDRKSVRLFGITDPTVKITPKDMIFSEKYDYVMLYDHIVRRKN